MFASVTIDLDGLDCYHTIHGLRAPPTSDPVHEIALPRYLDLLADLNIRSTLFVITRYLDRDQIARSLTAAAGRGHELASHTHAHPYYFGQLDRAAIAADLDRAAERIVALTGHLPVGFRAPGYNVSDAVLDVLEARAYRYDSSLLPSPPYYLAKWAIMTAMRVVGRRSGSAMVDVRSLLARIQPYRPDRRRFHRTGAETTERRLWEIPICVVPGLRLPVIGTSLTLLGSRRFRQIYPWLRRSPFINLEFHGIDFLDPGDPGVTEALRRRQADLRRPLDQKIRTFRDVLRRMQRDYEFGTLAEMCDRLDESTTENPGE